MKRITVLMLISLCMAGCAATPTRKPMVSPMPSQTYDISEENALGEEITDEVMATKDRFQAYVVGSWTAPDSVQRLTVEDDHFVLQTDAVLDQESGTPSGDLSVNVMYGTDQDGNPVRITVGPCYEDAMIVSIDHIGEILFLRDAGDQ